MRPAHPVLTLHVLEEEMAANAAIGQDGGEDHAPPSAVIFQPVPFWESETLMWSPEKLRFCSPSPELEPEIFRVTASATRQQASEANRTARIRDILASVGT
jgi:hypothetical protein